jgi:hypothetical protein
MLEIVVLACAAVVAAGWVRAWRRSGLTRASLSHFWYFTGIWLVSFPLRALAIQHDLADLQAERRFSRVDLSAGVLLAVVLLVTTYAGYHSGRRVPPARTDRHETCGELRGLWTVAASIALAVVFLAASILAGFAGFRGHELNNARIGAGPFFLLGEFFVFAAVAYLGAFGFRAGRRRFAWAETILLALVLALAFVMTLLLHSRRLLATILFALVTVYAVRRRAGWVAVAAVLGSFALAPVLQALRYVDLQALLETGELASLERSEPLRGARYWTNSIGSTFEGADHVATYLQVGGWKEVVLGVDGGRAWAYNLGLTLVPRAFWRGKPILNGSLEEQRFLYPEMFPDGTLTTTLPPTFVVDFLFGGGLLPGLALAFLLGRALALWDRDLWDPLAPPAARAMALFAFVGMYNIVRSGTAFVTSLWIFAFVLGCAVGFGATVRVLRDTLRRAARPSGAVPGG